MKILQIKNCLECPYRKYGFEIQWSNMCSKEGFEIKNIYIIDPDCDLEDYKEEEN